MGETASIRQRLQQHRNNYNNNKQHKCRILTTIIINVNNKSKSRAMETFLIKELKDKNFNIEFGSDESHKLSGSNEEYKIK